SLHLRAMDPTSEGASVILIGSRPDAQQAWVSPSPIDAQLGFLPLNVDLAPGQHELSISAVGHRPVVVALELRAEQTLEFPVDLPWLTGSIIVEAPERGAKIDLDGVPAGFTPAVLAGVRVGSHHLVVTSPGFHPYDVDVDVATDTAAPVTAALVSLNEVTAANRTAQSAEDAPASVTLVSADELRLFGDTTVWQALSNARGFYGTSDGTYEYLGVRGFARSGDYNNRILLTRDGHTLNDDQLGASYVGHDGAIDLSDVERIEVVRGAGSVLYGSNAFLGVVNLVSRSGEAALPTHVVLGAESERTARVSAGTRVKLGESWLSVNAGGLLSQGLDYQFPELATDENPLGTSQDAAAASAAAASARLTGTDWSVVAWGNLRRKGIPTGAYDTILADPRAQSEDARGFAEVRWEPVLSKATTLATRAYVDRYTFEGRYPYAGEVSADGEAEPDDVVADSWRGTWGGAEARVLLNPTAWLGLTGGAEARLHLQAGLEGSDNAGAYLSSNTPFQVYSGYLLADLNPTRAFSLSGGARLDAYSTFGVTVNPRLALIARPGEHNTVKVLGGRAFRAPSPYELGYNDNGVTQIAAPDLGPEHIWSGEVEYTRRLGEVSTLTVSGFGHRIDNLIILTTTPPAPDPDAPELQQATKLQYANDTRPINAVGVEGELRREWRRGWLAGATITAQRSRTDSLFDGEPLENSPSVIVGVRGAMPLAAGITLASRVRSESSRLGLGGARTPTVLVWDVNATGSIALGRAARRSQDEDAKSAEAQARSGRLGWSLGVRNLLDWGVYYPTGDEITHSGGVLPGAGRAVTAELAASW
ncbi:MAG: PEGA domain-containing protein, partial [Myxococcales bacterium]|nr:PEGA domain-containing protein [Myxococcales bacterium]